MEKKQLILTEESIIKIEKSCKIQSFIRLWIIENHPENKSILADEDTDLLVGGFLNTNFTVNKKGKELLEIVSNKIDISNKWHDLHKELQAELQRLTGKKQIQANGGYSFLCNEQDLQHKLGRAITKYKLKDWEKIKKLLLLHIKKSHKQNFQKVFLVQYYIEKNGMSALASDYESMEEIAKTNEKVVEEIKDIKNLF